MRAELEGDDYFVYGLSESDFQYIFDLVLRVQESHIAQAGSSVADLVDDPEAVEIVADVMYYSDLDTVFLWEYALWRLQGVFEGLIVSRYLPVDPPTHLPGLTAKLNSLKAAGYSLTEADEKELLRWAKLRNAISHRPPEQYRPIRIEEADVREYLLLVQRVSESLREQGVSAGLLRTREP